MSFRAMAGTLAATMVLSLGLPQAASADAVADFYKGKTISIYVGFPPGGGYDIYSRLVERHYGKFIPGNPQIVVQNMPGGAGVKVAAFIANASAQDGRALGVMIDSLTLTSLLRPTKKFDTTKFKWIGRVTTTSTVGVLWHTAPAHSVMEARNHVITTAASARGGASSLIPNVLNAVVGTKFKPIAGYRGTSDFALAMERGEVNGIGAMSWEALKTRKAGWLKDNKITVMYIQSTERHPELPKVPALTDFAKNDDDRKLLSLLGSSPAVGRSFAAEPGIPADRAAALRSAFMKMVGDAAFLADAKKSNLVVDPVDGATVQKIVAAMAATPKPLVDKLKQLNRKPKKK